MNLKKYKWYKRPFNSFDDCRLPTYFEPVDVNKYVSKIRIGSSSSNGEVYLLDKINSVIKVIPYDKGRTELKYAREASELVKQGVSTYFPIVYQDGKCNNTIYRHSSKLLYRTLHYQIKKMTSHNKKLYSLFGIIESICSTKTLLQIAQNYFGNKLNISSYYIINEWIWGDLQQLYSTYDLTRSSWIEIIKQILFGIIDMQRHLHIIHNDMKFENILVFKREGKWYIKINDFGEACDIRRPEDKIYDVQSILSAVIDKHNLHHSVRSAAKKSIVFIDKYGACYFKNDRNAIREMIEFYW